MDERTLVRRVATGACAVALLTMPVARLALGDHESWIAGVQFVVLALALLGLRRRRLSLGAVIMPTAVLLWLVVVVSFGRSVATVAAGGQVVGFGSGPLWLSSTVGPLVFLAFPLWRALRLLLVAAAALVVLFVIRAGGAAGEVLFGTGLWFQVVASAAILFATTVVALLADRSARERQEAEELRLLAGQERRDLMAAQRHRQEVFTRTATDLRHPMGELGRAVEELAQGPEADGARNAARVAEISGAVLDRIVASLRALVDSVHADDAAASLAPDDEPEGDGRRGAVRGRRQLVGVVGVVVVVLVTVVDGLRLAALVQSPGADVTSMALAGSRMVLVLFIGAAAVAILRPDPVGWVAVGAALLVHPTAVLTTVSAASAPVVAQTLVLAWRNALLATTFVVLLAVIIERRARARDHARSAAARDVASSRELRRADVAAERTYAEAAHELKNPLSVITAGATTLATIDTLTELQRSQLREAVVRSTARLAERLRVMRVVAGVADEEVLVVSTAVIDVQQALDNAARVAAGTAGTAGGAPALDVDLRCDGARIAIVPEHLEHVVENLLGNAHAYGEAGGEVRLVGRLHDGEVHVEVANRGGELTPAGAQHVFEPYWRASDGDGTPTGSGLGLAIVARLVDGWQGTRWCSVSEGWTRVGFTIPLVGTTVERAGPSKALQPHT